MARPLRYRLEALLRLKQRLKKKAEVELARALKQLEEEKKKLEKLEEEKKEIQLKEKENKKKMDLKMTAGSGVAVGQRYVNFLRKLAEDLEQKVEEIEDQKDVIEKSKEAVVQTRANYIEAARQLRIMEKHKELWQKKIKKELNRLEEKEMDELGQTIHGLRRWRGEKPVFEL